MAELLRLSKVGDTLVNEELIRQGLAWAFSRYCDRPICQKWKQLEEEARKAKRGLWSMPKPVAPWEFRRQGRKRGAAKQGTNQPAHETDGGHR